MGYCSRLIVMNRCTFGYKNPIAFALKVAEFELEKIPSMQFNNSNSRVFNKPIDFDLNMIEVKNEISFDKSDNSGVAKISYATREDCYGETCKYGTVEAVAEELEKVIEEYPYDDYYKKCTLAPTLMYLKALIDSGNTQSTVVVHYGH